MCVEEEFNSLMTYLFERKNDTKKVMEGETDSPSASLLPIATMVGVGPGQIQAPGIPSRPSM